VAKVFQIVPQASKAGSGVPRHSQRQRFDDEGRHLHSGHRMPTNESSASKSILSARSGSWFPLWSICSGVDDSDGGERSW